MRYGLMSNSSIDINLEAGYSHCMAVKTKFKKATTFRLEPDLQRRLAELSELVGETQNKLANEALRRFVERRGRQLEEKLEATLASLRAHRRRDPRYERSIREFVDAEASLIADPAEGRRAPEVSSAQSRILKLLDG